MARNDKRFFAHVRFRTKVRKISHGQLIPPEANVKETFTLTPRFKQLRQYPNPFLSEFFAAASLKYSQIRQY